MICIVISTTFWFFNALNKNDYVTRINYPVSIEFDEELYVPTQPLPSKIPIEVSGGGWDLMTRYFGFKMTPINLKIDSPDQNGFVLSSTLRGSIMPELEPITINYFLQDSIRFSVERIVTSTVILEYDTAYLSLDNNYLRISPVVVSPKTIELTGPKSMIEALGDTLWLNNDITGVSEDFQNEVELPELPELVKASRNTVNISFQVVRLLAIDTTLPVNRINFPSKNWKLSTDRVAIKYRVPETSFDATDSTGIKLFVDYRSLKSDSTIVIQKQVLNSQILDVELTPEFVKAIRQ